MGQSASKSRQLPKSTNITRSVTPLNSKNIQKQKIQRPTHHKHTEPHNENANKMGIIRIEEVPLKLDQNHPSLRSLRNKKLLEKMTQEKNPLEKKQFLHPNEFVAIVEDLSEGKYSHEQIEKNYKLSNGVLAEILKSGLTVPKSKVDIKREKDDDKDLNRMNGIPNSDTKLEHALESLMKG